MVQLLLRKDWSLQSAHLQYHWDERASYEKKKERTKEQINCKSLETTNELVVTKFSVFIQPIFYLELAHV